jgi:hypothetical protein
VTKFEDRFAIGRAILAQAGALPAVREVTNIPH